MRDSFMKYRILGRTGFKVSELGLGGHEYARFLNPYHFPEKKPEEPLEHDKLLNTQSSRTKLIEYAINAGVNYFDTGLIEECQSLGLSLKTLSRRNEVHIAAETMSPVARLKTIPRAKWRDMIMEGVDERLKILGTKHIDIFNVHEVSDGYSRERFEFVIDVLKEVRSQGKIRAIGVAEHQPSFVTELVRKFDCFDSVMVPYNFHRQEAKILFPICKALDVGIVVMKPFCWPYYGIAFTNFCPEGYETGDFSPAQTALRWILKSPEVCTIVPGTNTMAELEENIAAVSKEGEVDNEILKKCLEIAENPEGKEKLRTLNKKGDIARTRAYIRGYAKKALEGWTDY
jgi:aryl-alcohol dehydrogenase-like predicted oxidoreductase